MKTILTFLASGIILLLALLLGAYWFRDPLLALLTPSGGATVARSIPYQGGARGTLDVYTPKNAKGAPVVVFFYGGSWQMGRKELYGFVGNALAARGIVTVIPDYRIYPEVKFPAFLEDGAAAMRWTRDNAAQFGGDPERIILMGHSAGAHIAAMLALDPQWLAAQHLSPAQDVRALVGLAGPYDFAPLTSDTLIDLFGGANRPETQPIHFVSRAAPPAFLATGDRDNIVLPRNTGRLTDELRALGVPVQEKIYQGRGHIGLILPFLGPLQGLAPVLDDVAAFVLAQPASKEDRSAP